MDGIITTIIGIQGIVPNEGRDDYMQQRQCHSNIGINWFWGGRGRVSHLIIYVESTYESVYFDHGYFI